LGFRGKKAEKTRPRLEPAQILLALCEG